MCRKCKSTRSGRSSWESVDKAWYISGVDTTLAKTGLIPIPTGAIEAFCQKWEVNEFALFGSVLRDDFDQSSDVDVLITFAPKARPTLFTLAQMEAELEVLFGRRVDLVERRGMEQCDNPYVRDPVMHSAKVIYAR